MVSVSLCSVISYNSYASLSDYAASKWAAFAFAEALRLEIKETGKNVGTTIVCPYFINTVCNILFTI